MQSPFRVEIPQLITRFPYGVLGRFADSLELDLQQAALRL
jgi:hypothetical protein